MSRISQVNHGRVNEHSRAARVPAELTFIERQYPEVVIEVVVPHGSQNPEIIPQSRRMSRSALPSSLFFPNPRYGCKRLITAGVDPKSAHNYGSTDTRRATPATGSGISYTHTHTYTRARVRMHVHHVHKHTRILAATGTSPAGVVKHTPQRG